MSPTEIIFSSPVIDTAHPVVVDVNTGDVTVLTSVPNFDVVDAHDGVVVASKTSTTSSPSIVVAIYDSVSLL